MLKDFSPLEKLLSRLWTLVFSVKCGTIGHSAENCSHRNKNTKFMQVWVPKNSTNKFHVYWNKNKRTKQVWVPKGVFIHNASVTNVIGPKSFSRSSLSLSLCRFVGRLRSNKSGI